MRSSAYFDGGISGSAEMLLSLEKAISEKASMLVWGGGGFIAMVAPDPFDEYNSGFEGAVECRWYPSSEDLDRYFIGVYYGLGYLYGPKREAAGMYQYATVQGFGIKMGYKHPVYGTNGAAGRFRIALEPYASLGATFYYQSDEAHLFTNHDWHAYWINIGLRMVFETAF